jgi:isohexenylglutaconyl-CoA hydratase
MHEGKTMTPAYETIYLEVAPPFAQVVLNRPHVKNAMNATMVEELIHVFAVLREMPDIRAVILTGANGTFCVGGDINELQGLSNLSDSQQISQTSRLDTLLRAVNSAPQVVIARIEGAALGGGFGLVCVSDIAITTTEARLGLPEVRLGLVPSVISPYVIRRVGLTRARQMMLMGARFDGVAAQEYGVVHEVLSPDAMDVRIEELLNELRHCAPNALRACKALIMDVVDKPLDDTLRRRAELLNTLRVSEEAQEGMRAFVEKRRARWAKG